MEKISDSDYSKSISHVTQNMVLDDTGTSESLDCIVVVEANNLIIDAGIGLTIGNGKKLIPNTYNT